MTRPFPHGINDTAALLTDALVARAHDLRIGVSEGAAGERLIDAGANCVGGIEAGVRIAEICMGGLGHVSLTSNEQSPKWPWRIVVRSSQPLIACLGSQYAGWSLSHGEGKDAYFAMGSGPARALAGKEELFGQIGFRDQSKKATLIIEAESPPPQALVETIAHDCHVQTRDLSIIYAPTRSLSGTIQIMARVLEVALHKAHTLRFPLENILDGLASAPVAPPHPDFVTAMGRTNDAIIYGGTVHLFVKGDAAAAQALANALPSRNSRDYGEPFASTFRRTNGDFYAIDPSLFSPASVIVTAIDGGATFHAGFVDRELLDASFA
jgi:methenyltetrahydromethanopterin cyclohydrolase